jgi:hypothetical protein
MEEAIAKDNLSYQVSNLKFWEEPIAHNTK